MNDRTKLRLQIRTARKEIPPGYARRASYKFSEQIAVMTAYQEAAYVSGFLPFDGEADPLPLMDRAIQDGKQVFVPVIVGRRQPLMFAPWTRRVNLRRNSFGIDEPAIPQQQWVSGNQLQLVITPLVGFDTDGNRLGVGGGYFDRTFAFLKDEPTTRRNTQLIGIAYELQKLARLDTRAWDVPLDAVVTELAVYQRG